MLKQGTYNPFLIGILVSAWLIMASPAPAELSGVAEANPRLLQQGTPFRITITVDADSNIQLTDPAFPEVEGLTLTDTISPEISRNLSGGRTSLTATYSAEYMADEPGEYEIGPFDVIFTTESGSREVLSIDSVTVEVYKDAPRPPSGIVVAKSLPWWKYILTAVIVAVAIGFLIWYLRKTKGAIIIAIPGASVLSKVKTPEMIALESIQALEIPDESDWPAVREYYDKVDDILRLYLTRRYSVQTRDATSWEVRQEFVRRKRLDPRLKGVFVMINDCDWVKFAKSWPTRSDILNVPIRAAEILTGNIKAEEEKIDSF